MDPICQAADIFEQKRTRLDIPQHAQISTDRLCCHGIIERARLLFQIEAALGKCRAGRPADQ
ncbi:hypothetical protein ASC98_14585 [Rhizobacter sp. Root1238]|nr:hypothetical protein ASC88_07335 [Rhizobacter sp. Root29]KQW15343.1 hypothetical protein ASC98_14585 [Rhizobacter sp. Root1238]